MNGYFNLVKESLNIYMNFFIFSLNNFKLIFCFLKHFLV